MNPTYTHNPAISQLTEQHLKFLLSRITFRDWSFRVMQSGDGFLVQVAFVAPDSRDGADREQRGRKWYVSRHATVSEIMQTALAAVLAAVEHEAREDFLVDGRAIYHPHHQLVDLIMIANSTDARPAPFPSEEPAESPVPHSAFRTPHSKEPATQ